MSVSGLIGQNNSLTVDTLRTNSLIVGGNAFNLANRGTFLATGISPVNVNAPFPLTTNSQVFITVKGTPTVSSGTWISGISPKANITGNSISFTSFAGDTSIYNWLVIG